MADIYVGSLIPGAQLVTASTGPGGTITADRTSAWAGIDPSMPISANLVFTLHQEATVDGQNLPGGTAQSLPVPEFTLGQDLLPQPLLDPLVQCDTSRNFDKVVPGAQTAITNNTQSELWGNISEKFHGWGGPPLQTSSAVATQAMPRCGLSGQPVTLPVAAATTPTAPTATQDLCPQTLRLSVYAESGSTLHVFRAVKLSSGNFDTTPVSDYSITYTPQPIDLPADIQLTDPNGPVFISLTQTRCAGTSGNTLVSVAPVAGPFGAPTITGTLWACGHGIPITGAHPGSLVWAMARTFEAGSAAFPISDPAVVTSPNMLVTPWYGLPSDHAVFVQQLGCNAAGHSNAPSVHPQPSPLPVPTIGQPVLPTATSLTVTGVLQGARVSLLVNGQLRPDSFDVYTDPAVIPISGPPLTVGETVLAVQTLCSSSPDRGGVPVVKGNLKVTVTPKPIVRGKTTEVTVDAYDTSTELPVTGLTVQIGSQPPITVQTGTPFAYSPALGASDPLGTVLGGSNYQNAPFTITLVDPSWTLSMHTGPVPVFLGTALEFTVTNITWHISPDWDPALAKTIPVNSPTPPKVVTNVPLPIPTGTVKTVTVTISGTVSTQGGDVNGYIVPAQDFQITTDTQTVSQNSTAETIAWILAASAQQDPQNPDLIDIYVSPVFQGFSP
jgi:hypothetical protein